MSCPNPVELSRALIAGIDDRLRAHLEICTRCSEQLESHATVAAETRQLAIIDPTPEHAHHVRASLMAAARAPAPITRSRFVWGFATAGALAAAAVLAFVLIRPQPPTQTAATTYRGTLLPQRGAALLRVSGAPDEIVRLAHGTVSVQVARLEPGERFRVVTGDAELEARETAFDVTVDRDRVRAVRVLQGHVEIRAYGSAAKVLQAGERWDTQLAVAEPNRVAPAAGSPRAPAPADGSPRQPTSVPAIAPAPADGSPRATARADDLPRQPTSIPAIAPAPADGSPPAPAPADGSRRATAPVVDEPVAHGSAKQQPTSKPAIAPAPATPHATTKRDPAASAHVPATPSITSRQTVSQAPARAKRPIELLFDEGWAALAAGDAATAAASFERAAQSAPKDPLAEDAWFWRASALARTKSTAAAAALDSFLARYPSSPRVGEASAMLGWLIMDRDLDRADKLFRAAEHDRVAAVRASATKGLAAIAQRRSKSD